MSPCIGQSEPLPNSEELPGGAGASSFAASVSLAVVILSVCLGAWLRVSGLSSKSITHPEMYVPGIHLAEGASEPVERLSLAPIITGTFSSDTHPPGYYNAMLAWTKAFGTSLRAIR